MTLTPSREFDAFREVLKANIERRSRSLHGQISTEVSNLKPAALVDSTEIRAVVDRSVSALAEDIWSEPPRGPIPPPAIRETFERWNYLLTNQLLDETRLQVAVQQLQSEAADLQRSLQLEIRVHARYRVWAWSKGLRLPPILLEPAMDFFYIGLAGLMRAHFEGRTVQAELLAFSDYMIDTAIHPWADGCARVATASVMWLSLAVRPYRLPIFDTREAHYRAHESLNSLIQYYERCLSRSQPDY